MIPINKHLSTSHFARTIANIILLISLTVAARSPVDRIIYFPYRPKQIFVLKCKCVFYSAPFGEAIATIPIYH